MYTENPSKTPLPSVIFFGRPLNKVYFHLPSYPRRHTISSIISRDDGAISSIIYRDDGAIFKKPSPEMRACFYLRPAQIYKSPILSVRLSRCQSQPFDPLTIFLFSRNSVSICTSIKVTSGHISQGRSPKVKVTRGDKLVKFHNFFTFLRTPPAFLIRHG